MLWNRYYGRVTVRLPGEVARALEGSGHKIPLLFFSPIRNGSNTDVVRISGIKKN